MNGIDAIKQAYPEATLLVDLARNVWDGRSPTVKIEFAISDRLKAEFLNLTGNDIQAVFITDSGTRHIKKQHGHEEALRGQVDITPDDFAFIPLVLNEFDTVEHTGEDKRGNKKILFTKKISETIYLATIERGPSKMEIRTFWKMRGPGASC
ncbi:MAG: hypothetical protein LBK27_08505 [Treponema sp.]|jgi:hypothetical protein|nr:hypothetical protein [Treponema sp.]